MNNASLKHILNDINVTHTLTSCLTDSVMIYILLCTLAKVGHDRGNDGIGQQLATLLHVATVDVQDMVAGDNITLFIHTQATIRIAVIGKTDVQPFLYHELLQAFDVGGTCIVVDIQTVRLCIDDVGICTQSIEYRLCDVPRTAVGTVQTNLDAFKGIDAEADQVAHVAVAACNVVHTVQPICSRWAKGSLGQSLSNTWSLPSM